MRCVARRRLFSNNPGTAILLVVFLVGASFFALGTLLVRRDRLRGESPQHAPAREPQRATPSFEDIDALLVRADAQSIRELERLRDSDASPEIRGAAEDALIVIASR
jgi:hypothetical protein